MKVFFPDSNLFLQCRDLNQLPWNEIAPNEEEILLAISRPIQREIDKLKHDGNDRRAKRARKANSFIRTIVLAPNSEVLVRNSSPIVRAFFPLPCDIQSSSPKDLDLSITDDQIIAEALSYQSQNPQSDVAILTHDTNPLLTAKRSGLSYRVVPDDWLLQPEPDTRDKRIKDLERRLAEIEDTRPSIEIISLDSKNQSLNSVLIEVVRYRSLTKGEIDEFIAQAKSWYPMVTEWKKPGRSGTTGSMLSIVEMIHQYEIPTDSEIQKYQEQQYPSWIEKLRSFLESLSTKLEVQHRHSTVLISIQNTDSFPAEHAFAEFRASENLLLRMDSQAREFLPDHPLKPPRAPKPPEGKWVQFGNLLSTFASTRSISANIPVFPSLTVPKPRDRNAFYWVTGKGSQYSPLLSLECEEFRHQLGPKMFDITIAVTPKERAEKGVLICRFGAKNLPQPTECHIPVNIIYSEGDTMEKVKNLIEALKP
jgi:hypothetical protein